MNGILYKQRNKIKIYSFGRWRIKFVGKTNCGRKWLYLLRRSTSRSSLLSILIRIIVRCVIVIKSHPILIISAGGCIHNISKWGLMSRVLISLVYVRSGKIRWIVSVRGGIHDISEGWLITGGRISLVYIITRVIGWIVPVVRSGSLKTT